ncbi:MAG TPA: hypothetical protein PL174_01410 [Fervidobacterium sp.]|nr:hypothetical protein [Fervidobacterium sp.]HPT58991.1 hypothetical protein [Fervidobacterium sp.]
MKASRSRIGKKRKEERNIVKPIVIITIILLAVAAMFLGSRIFVVRNSEEFSADKVSLYYFYVENPVSNDASVTSQSNGASGDGKIIIVNGERRSVELINIPATTYIYSKNLDVSTSSPRDFSILFAELIGMKPDFTYFIPQRSEFFKKVGVNDIDDFVTVYGKRGLKLTDYFVLGSQVSSLRPESNITDSSLARLYYALGTYSLRKHDLPTLTKAPLKITVGNRQYFRSYVDEEKLGNLMKEIGN